MAKNIPLNDYDLQGLQIESKQEYEKDHQEKYIGLEDQIKMKKILQLRKNKDLFFGEYNVIVPTHTRLN